MAGQGVRQLSIRRMNDLQSVLGPDFKELTGRLLDLLSESTALICDYLTWQFAFGSKVHVLHIVALHTTNGLIDSVNMTSLGTTLKAVLVFCMKLLRGSSKLCRQQLLSLESSYLAASSRNIETTIFSVTDRFVVKCSLLSAV